VLLLVILIVALHVVFFVFFFALFLRVGILRAGFFLLPIFVGDPHYKCCLYVRVLFGLLDLWEGACYYRCMDFDGGKYSL